MTILDLEYAVHAWMADTDEDQGTEQARAVLRGMIGRLDEVVTEGLRDPVDKLRPAVDPLVELRSALRAAGPLRRVRRDPGRPCSLRRPDR